MIKLKIIASFLLLHAVFGFSQNREYNPVFYKLTNLSGNVRLSGNFSFIENESDAYKASSLFAGISLSTKSFFYHPNLLTLDVSAGYEPKIIKMQAIVRPDYTVNGSSKFINASAQLFRFKNYKLNPFIKFSENYNNRENLTMVKSISKFYGVNFISSNKYVPILLHYKNVKNESEEIQMNRKVIRDEVSLEVTAEKKYGNDNLSRLKFKNDNYTNEILSQVNKYNNKSFVNNISFLNTFNLKMKRNASVSSDVQYNNFESNGISQNTLNIYKTLFLELPYRFDFTSKYKYTNSKFQNNNVQSQNASGLLKHQLYKSLTSSALWDYSKLEQSFYSLNNRNYEINFNYLKKLPWESSLNISYSYRKSFRNSSSATKVLPILNEEHILSDNEILLIKNSNVTIASIVVKDATGTINFQENLDYILIKLGEFIEVKRVAGGLIENNSPILIDYTALQAGQYELKSNANSARIMLSVFKNKLNVYYTKANLNYINPISIESLILDNFKQNIYGAKLNFGIASGGIEYDDFESNLTPRRTLKYNMETHGNFKRKVFYNMNFSFINYLMLIEEGRSQKFYNLNGNISVPLNYKSNLNFRVGYRKQIVDDLNMDWLTAFCEYGTDIRQLKLKVNVNYYNNNNRLENTNFIGVGIQVSRSF